MWSASGHFTEIALGAAILCDSLCHSSGSVDMTLWAMPCPSGGERCGTRRLGNTATRQHGRILSRKRVGVKRSYLRDSRTSACLRPLKLQGTSELRQNLRERLSHCPVPVRGSGAHETCETLS
ncbi:hypothetical protein K466DRAFT_245997 [Polyporus arcularius HHB13444]|uniref:Uncharacterized protein n=1 Tax=Polyporus arcularius HHB13444 TaxID=1314778 RepID=A0A5C3Q2R7_9APHY|nr:hypothetical protein K466DRAFT_245997 [Polyporus arcularius HHB13444]